MEAKSATKTFRQAVLLISLSLALTTVILMAAGLPDCQTANLYFAIYKQLYLKINKQKHFNLIDFIFEDFSLLQQMSMIFFVYSVVFIMMLLQFIGLVSCLKTIPRAIMGFYFLLVAIMFYVQMILFKGDNCSQDSPVLFIWLVAQIALNYDKIFIQKTLVGLFYFIVAFGLAKWGSYICWQAENHDQMAKRAVDDYFKKLKQNQLMLEQDDKNEPLLSEEHKYSDEDSESEDEEDNRKRKHKKNKIHQKSQLAIEN